MDKIELGSKTAKEGFKNEILAQKWLETMGYAINSIKEVKAEKIKGSFKADVQVVILVQIQFQKLQNVQNLQVKLVSNPQGFNQIDKRWLKSYKGLWQIPSEVYELLQYFLGEIPPKIQNPKDKRRMFLNELSQIEQEKVLNFFKDNYALILNDILKGRGQFASE